MNPATIIMLIQLAEAVGPPLILMIKSFVELIESKNPDQGAAAAGKLLEFAMIEVQAFANADFGPITNEEAGQKKFDHALLKTKEIAESVGMILSETDLRNAVQNAYSILKAGNLPKS